MYDDIESFIVSKYYRIHVNRIIIIFLFFLDSRPMKRAFQLINVWQSNDDFF